MTVLHLVAYTAWTCAGSFQVLGLRVPLAALPAAARPTLGVFGLCRGEPRLEAYDPARLPAARARVQDLGPGASLTTCRGVTCRAHLVRWTQTAVID